jgi:hypothetical protein
MAKCTDTTLEEKERAYRRLVGDHPSLSQHVAARQLAGLDPPWAIPVCQPIRLICLRCEAGEDARVCAQVGGFPQETS